jgi:copper chaperone CopZ
LSRVTLGFANASCRHCARVVTNSLQQVDGVLTVQVDQVGRRVMVHYDPSRVSIGTLQSMMEGSGYSTRLIG